MGVKDTSRPASATATERFASRSRFRPALTHGRSPANRDGRFDVAVANVDNGLRTGYASVLLGNGDGTLRSPVSCETGWGAEAVAAGDFNGDGRPDIVVADNFVADVAVLLGRGDGTFQSAAHYPSKFGVRALAIADFDRDGGMDIAAAVAQSNMISVCRNAGIR